MSCCEREIQLVKDLEANELALTLQILDYEARIRAYQEFIDATLAPLSFASDNLQRLKNAVQNAKDALQILRALLATATGLFAYFRILALVAAAEAALAAATAALTYAAVAAGFLSAAAAAAILTTLGQQAYVQSQLASTRRTLMDVRFELRLARFRLVECKRYCDDSRPEEPQSIEYEVIPYGTLPTGATCVSDIFCRVVVLSSFFGVSVGVLGGPLPSRTYLLVGRRLIDPIADLGDDPWLASAIRGVNASGVASGFYWRHVSPTERTGQQAFTWDPVRGRVDLFVGGARVVETYGIRDDGTIAARLVGNEVAVLIRDGKIVELLPFELGNTLRMNSAGEILGRNSFRAVDGTQYALPLLPGSEVLYALGLGPKGRVVGYCAHTDRFLERAFTWSLEEGMREVPGLGGESTQALAVNALGQVVGRAKLPGSTDGLVEAFIWDPETNKTRNLNRLIDPARGIRLLTASCLDDTGRIGGYCFIGGGNGQGYLLRSLRLDWGAKVKVTTTDGRTVEDFLVAIEPEIGRIVLQKGIEATRGAAFVRTALAFDEVSDITLSDPRDGFNLYLVAPERSSALVSVQTAEFIGFSAGVCRYAVRTVPGGKVRRREVSGRVRGMWAILRRTGENPIAEEQVTRLGGGSVPAQLIAAIAYKESHGDGESWRQFAPTFRGSCRKATLVNAEGAIGMMQLTNVAALSLSNFSWDEDPTHLPFDPIGHLYRLSSDVDYNVEAGVRFLRYLLRNPPAAVRRLRPRWFVPGAGALEHWYQATHRYNGRNGYEREVWEIMATAPYGVPYERVSATIPAFEAPETAFPAHIDLYGSGRVEVEVDRPEVTVREGAVEVRVSPRALHDTILSVDAGLVRPQGYTDPVRLEADGAGAWVGRVPLDASGAIVFGEGVGPRITVRSGTTLVYIDIAAGTVIPDGAEFT